MKIFIKLFVVFFSSMADAKLVVEPEDISRNSYLRRSLQTNDSRTSCIPPRLAGFINELRTRFGSVEINSGYRSPQRNRAVGGARFSRHMSCSAIDFRVPGVPKSEVRLFLTANFRGRAGVGYYCNDRFHLDSGNARQWGGCQPSSREISLAQRRYPRSSPVQLARLSTGSRIQAHEFDQHDMHDMEVAY